MRHQILILTAFIVATVMAERTPLVIQVTNESNGEVLPFSSLRITDKGILHSDENGILLMNYDEGAGKEAVVSAFGHENKNVTIPQLTEDTIKILLKEIPVVLNEIEIQPLKKDKEFKTGRQRIDLGILNRGYVLPPFMEDSTLREMPPYEFGYEFKTPPNKLFRLKAFGMNVVPSDSMINELDILISIYDMEHCQHADTIPVPTPISKPIQLKFHSSEIDRKKREFRYVFPEEIDLPKDAVVMVSLGWSMKDGRYSTEGKELILLFTRNGKWYKEGNPLREFNPPFSGKKKRTPFFWEYIQYSLPTN